MSCLKNQYMSDNIIINEFFLLLLFLHIVDVYYSSSCTVLVLFSHVVIVWRSNTQLCLQSVDFVL